MMIKKFFSERFFNWTAQDVADWEKVREKGLLRFILRYGMMLFSGVLFVLLAGTVLLFTWNGPRATRLMPELIFIALACLVGGLLNSLITWWMEEKLYKKFKKIHSAHQE